MRRTIEKLTHRKKEKAKAYLDNIEYLAEAREKLSSTGEISNLESRITRLQESLKSSSEKGASVFRKKSAGDLTDAVRETAGILSSLQQNMQHHFSSIEEALSVVHQSLQDIPALMDAADREWDALASNHVGMIFKSMEWRVDKLSAHYEDAALIMKKFIRIKEKLDRILGNMDKNLPPKPGDVKDVIRSVSEWKYTGFENRYRGDADQVKEQLVKYLSYFDPERGPVLDLGCGRGEFLDLLIEKGFEAEGVDVNSQMIEICQDRGFPCKEMDILDRLRESAENSWGGIFSSQVIEHLSPEYLKSMIEEIYFKLKPGGAVALETVNPLSVFALVQIYFLDLTHQKPLHPQTMRFLLESSGFGDVNIVYTADLEGERLQEIPAEDEKAAVFNRNVDKLNSLLYAPANFAVVGIKKN